MGAIREFNFSDFTSAIKNQLGNAFGNAFDAKVEENMQGLKSIFDEAAKNDGGENDELFEAYEGGKFNELVKKGADFVLKTVVENMGEKFKATLAKFFNKDKKLDIQEEAESIPQKARELVKQFNGLVPDYAVAAYCKDGGNLFDIQNALTEYCKDHDIDFGEDVVESVRRNHGLAEQE